MFPNSYHSPALASQDMIHFNVFDDVALNLRDPVVTVAFYAVLPVLPVIAMPEIPVTEDGDLVFHHGDIRMPVNGAAVLPEPETPVPESVGEDLFN